VLIEALETRRLMAAHVSVSPNGILTVQGSSADEVVAIIQAAEGPVQVSTAAGAEEPTVVGTWNGLKGIFVYLGNGDNRVDLETRVLPAVVITGNGIDLVSVVNHNTENAVIVSTGGGDDSIQVQDVGSFGTAVLAGAGNDGITFTQASGIASRRSIAFGDDGNDDFRGPGNADVELGFHDAGVGFATFYGGAGNDTFHCFNVDTIVHGGESPRDHDAATYCLASGTLPVVLATDLESPIHFDIVVVVPPAP
jgi:hypothetical protein